jgi:hypothetical protein
MKDACDGEGNGSRVKVEQIWGILPTVRSAVSHIIVESVKKGIKAFIFVESEMAGRGKSVCLLIDGAFSSAYHFTSKEFTCMHSMYQNINNRE